MRPLNFVHRAFGLARSVAYTSLVRFEFAALGPLSVIDPPAKLVEPHLIRIGNRVHICEHAWLNAKDTRRTGAPTLSIGDGTYIGRFVHINAWQDVVIENDVLIADRVFVSDADHNYEDENVPVRRQGDRFKGPVRLQTGCWLGIGVVVLPGVTVGRNAVVAANSVVTKDVPDRAIVAGSPAKVIKSR